jgi:hypothetical protein
MGSWGAARAGGAVWGSQIGKIWTTTTRAPEGLRGATGTPSAIGGGGVEVEAKAVQRARLLFYYDRGRGHQ